MLINTHPHVDQVNIDKCPHKLPCKNNYKSTAAVTIMLCLSRYEYT